ncbi:hypothetical protein [Halobacillus karajensis]|uniref:D-glucuronyl C5-epimerase C-terminal domain-containing protein n=2 Tax=Halobacillus karajensis TaxID=195088 RepID=A0A059NV87_9BACI|nr:hypothetical protein [Halobacillus karajensis]CDQ22975.1 hypothetical protein BN983_01194 [Halobacillus karajensis]
MYKATGDEKYLELFVPQADYIFTQTDEKLGVESFTDTNLSLPAWSDRGHYTAGKFNYTYPVHTGMITLPILRFVETVKSNDLDQFEDKADKFLKLSGRALAIHNKDNMWRDFSESEGFYMGHSYGQGIVSEAGKIGVPNRISIYLAACGLYDKMNGSNIYTERINKSLNYIKNSLLKYDEEYDSYYWSYWEEQTLEKPWEDISHATITLYGIYILHEEGGFSVFRDKDFEKFANNIDKIIDDNTSPPKIRKFIHKRDEEKEAYYSEENNPYYHSILNWSFLGNYDKKVFDKIEQTYEQTNETMTTEEKLRSIALYLYAKEK